MLDIDYVFEDLIALVVIDFELTIFFAFVKRYLDQQQVEYLLDHQNLEL